MQVTGKYRCSIFKPATHQQCKRCYNSLHYQGICFNRCG